MMRRSSDQQRVLIIVENVALARDHRLRKQVSSLVRAGFDVSVICRRDPANRAVEGVHLFEYRPPPEPRSKWGFVVEYGYSWFAALVLVAVVWKKRGIDVVQVCGAPDIYFPLCWILHMAGKLTVYDQRDPSPELYDAHFGAGPSVIRSLLVRLEHATYKAADQVLVVNDSLRDIARSRGAVPAHRITVVGNGPVLDRVLPRAPRPELKQGRNLLCCWAGLIGPEDAVDHALHAIDHLVHEHGLRDSLFVFVGDGEARAECQRLSDRLGLTNFVRFPGWLSEGEVFDYLATADIGIEPNLEPFVSPVKVMEYMAFGVPVAAFDLRETRALADDAALYAPAGNDVELAHRVAALSSDPALRATLGRNGRRRVESTVAWDHQETAYLSVFDGLLKKRLVVPARRAGNGGLPHDQDD